MDSETQKRILVIEDEDDILEVIEYNLAREGYAVVTSKDGLEGLMKARKGAFNLVILDLMLPGLDGIEVCRRLKMDPVTGSIPIVMVTAKGEETDVVLGLGVGADDYIRKPFSPKELVARVKAVLRRGPMKEETGARERIVLGGLVVDSTKFEVAVDGDTVPFTATEFKLLHFFASHPDRVFTREDLVVRVIGDDSSVLSRNIDAHIKAIRKKLGAYKDCIATVRGVGYKFKNPN
jgi:two-component system alkaline phosphatase synthesis response regulator PhoP